MPRDICAAAIQCALPGVCLHVAYFTASNFRQHVSRCRWTQVWGVICCRADQVGGQELQHQQGDAQAPALLRSAKNKSAEASLANPLRSARNSSAEICTDLSRTTQISSMQMSPVGMSPHLPRRAKAKAQLRSAQICRGQHRSARWR